LLFKNTLMKKTFTYLLLLVSALIAGCIKKPVIVDPGSLLGTFNGSLFYLHRPLAGGSYDTSKTSVQLVLSSGIGYEILGDTSTFQAGSHGNFGEFPDSLLFTDQTLPASGVPAPNSKLHLNGVFRYTWNGTSLQMVGKTDSTVSEYVLTRTSTQQ
jgi:hypothetical protein